MNQISSEAVEKVARTLLDAETTWAAGEITEHFITHQARAAIYALLSSGEVVLRADVEKLVDALHKIATGKGHNSHGTHYYSCYDSLQSVARDALAPFKTGGGDV